MEHLVWVQKASKSAKMRKALDKHFREYFMHPFACQTHTRWHMSVSCHQPLIQVVCQQKFKKKNIPCCIDVFLRIKSLKHGSTWIIVLWAPIHQTIHILNFGTSHLLPKLPSGQAQSHGSAISLMCCSNGSFTRRLMKGGSCVRRHAKSLSVSRISLDVSQQGSSVKNVENSLNSNESNH